MKLTKHFISLAAAAVAIAGCAGPDMTMRNPILAGALDQNHIVKAHGYAETQNGLPPGVMSDEAVIDTLDKSQVCVNVSMHELAALDMTQAEVKLTTDTGSLLQPQLNASPPTSQTYQGLVPHTERTGTRVVCNTNSYGQTTCESQPVYSTTMIPGPVDVFNTKGRLCAPNQNLVTPATKEMALKITTPTAARGTWGGQAKKNVTFRWAFQ